MMTSTATNNDEAAGVGIAEAQAVATGVDQKQPQGRKSRVRKTNATPRAAVVKKKAPKAPRNPFRRSETGKLQLKSLQMTKRVATMAPRVAVLRERLETMESRMEFISGKLVLVKEELNGSVRGHCAGQRARVVVVLVSENRMARVGGAEWCGAGGVCCTRCKIKAPCGQVNCLSHRQ